MNQKLAKTRKRRTCYSCSIERKWHGWLRASITSSHFKPPCAPALTLRKSKTIMQSLKANVDKALSSRVGYHVFVHPATCAMLDRLTGTFIQFKEHKRQSQPYSKHIQLCGVNPSFDSVVKFLQSTCKSIPYLETLEALWQRELKPQINTKDEFCKCELTIKL